MCVLVQCAALGVTINCFSFFLHDWSNAFQIPASRLILGMVLFGFICSAFAPFVGRFLDRYSARLIVVVALVGIALIHVLIGFASHGWQIILLYALLPIPITFSTGIPAQTLVARWFDRWRGVAFSLSATGLVLAGIAFPPIVVWLISQVGWRMTWWIFALVVLVVAALAAIVLRDYPTFALPKSEVQAPSTRPDQPPPTMGRVFRTRNFWLVIIVFVAVSLMSSAVQANFAPLVNSKGLSPNQAAVLLAIFNVAAAGGKLFAGVLCDRIGNRVPLIMVACLATGGMFMLAHVTSFTALIVALVGLGMSQSIWVMLASCIAHDFGQNGFPRAYGIANMFSVITNFSPPALAWMYEQSGSYTFGLLALACICVPSMIAAFLYREEWHRPVRSVA